MNLAHPKDDNINNPFLVPKQIEKTLEHIYYEILLPTQEATGFYLSIGVNGWSVSRKNRKQVNPQKIKNKQFQSLIKIIESTLETADGYSLNVWLWLFLYMNDEKWRQDHGYYNCREHSK